MWYVQPGGAGSPGRRPSSTAVSKQPSMRIARALRVLIRASLGIWRQVITWRSRRRSESQRRSRFTRVVILQSGVVTPKSYGPADVVLIRSGTYNKRLQFNCPNGCGSMVVLNLSTTRQPHWSATYHSNGTISVYPSVVNKECGAHFIIRKSYITWL